MRDNIWVLAFTAYNEFVANNLVNIYTAGNRKPVQKKKRWVVWPTDQSYFTPHVRNERRKEFSRRKEEDKRRIERDNWGDRMKKILAEEKRLERRGEEERRRVRNRIRKGLGRSETEDERGNKGCPRGEED